MTPIELDVNEDISRLFPRWNYLHEVTNAKGNEKEHVKFISLSVLCGCSLIFSVKEL